MADIVGIRFRRAGKVYYFDPAGIDLEPDDRVVVETNWGRWSSPRNRCWRKKWKNR